MSACPRLSSTGTSIDVARGSWHCTCRTDDSRLLLDSLRPVSAHRAEAVTLQSRGRCGDDPSLRTVHSGASGAGMPSKKIAVCEHRADMSSGEKSGFQRERYSNLFNYGASLEASHNRHTQPRRGRANRTCENASAAAKAPHARALRAEQQARMQIARRRRRRRRRRTPRQSQTFGVRGGLCGEGSCNPPARLGHASRRSRPVPAWLCREGDSPSSSPAPPHGALTHTRRAPCRSAAGWA